MSKEANFWENHISNKHKNGVAEALGLDVVRIIEMDLKLASVGKDKRIDDARRKCAEKWARRDAEQNRTTTK